MMHKRVLTCSFAVALLAAACGGGSSTSKPPASGDPCGLRAFAAATKPVEVTFWHEMGANGASANADWMVQATKAFNQSQSDVHVRLVQFASYQDLFVKYLGGLSTKDLPDMFHPEDTTVQRLIDSQSVVPVQECADADHYSLDQLLPRAREYFSYKNVLYGMPWTLSNPVLWYNRAAFTKAGLDPDKPPTTLAQVEEYSRKIVASGAAKHGIALRVEPYVFEFLNAKSGGTLVNNGNGRDSRATAATLQTPVAHDIWTWWNDMVKSGLALDTGGGGNIDHMFALGNGQAAMTMEASGVLGTVVKVLETGQYGSVKIGTAALPSINGGGGVPVGDGSLWIAKAAPPVRQAAAWQFIKYLASREQQAAVAIAGGFAPIRSDATTVPALVTRWRAQPIYRVAYDQLTTGEENASTAGSLIGDYQGVRDAVKDGLLSMLTGGLTPDAALAKAQHQADAAIKAYNDRLGVG
ncbi:MAG TPA: ABC transporter substrate-binding protein [Acidimicrobiia bacterium]|nr:ABC transporter substrate-binding protein [Acidimicrobiia bacterium]